MSLVLLSEGWKRFGSGRIWRCKSPYFFCEVDREGNIPSYEKLPSSVSSLRKIIAFYNGKLKMGTLDSNGTGLDILSANSMTESFGSVPTPFSFKELEQVFKNSAQPDEGRRLAAVVDYIKIRQKWLIRKEPGYIDPLTTPHRISVGAHHVLLSTALNLLGHPDAKSRKAKDALRDLVFRLPSESAYAANLAILYFNRVHAKHSNEPPLLAAIYNAGSLRTANNPWNLRQYGDHLDRWISFYNTCRHIRTEGVNVTTPVVTEPIAQKPVLELKVIRKEFTEKSTIGELYINEQFYCYTLEDRYRPDGKKVYGQTAIPEGRYQVVVNFSNRFKQVMPQVLNVPGFEGIRIHTGNTDADTHGCLLVGRKKMKDAIAESRIAYNSLLKKIKDATSLGKCYITLKKENRSVNPILPVADTEPIV